MPSRINNEFGSITIDNEVVVRIAGQAVMECAGVVGMAAKNVKDGIVLLLKKENMTGGVQLSSDDGKMVISLHIIVKYGTNIKAVTETIMHNVKYEVEDFAGVEVYKVNIFIEGIREDN